MPERDIPPGGAAGLKRLRHRLERFALDCVRFLVPRLPFGLLAPVSRLLGTAAYYLDARGRPTAIENLRAAFGDRFDDDGRIRVARASYQSFARTMLCLFWSPNLTEENYNRYFRIEGLDDDPVHRDADRAGIYFCFHFSNFEWLSHASAFAIRRGIIIAQKFKNPLIGPVFNRLRSTSGHEVIPQERAIVRMLKLLKAGGKFGVLTDLSLDPKHAAVPIKCFGLWTAASPLLSVLATRTNARLIPCECHPSDDGKFIMRYHPGVDLPPDASPADITQACWDALEPSIHQRPECWLWAYKQWRFKPSDAPDAGRFPAYAHTASRFDKLIKGRPARP